MSKYHRKEKVFEYITDKSSCSIDELLKHFDVSLSTIHRDLDTLEREGRIDKTYGRASLNDEKILYQSRININVELKKKLAEKALEFIENGDTIFLDNSTTCYYLAEALCKSSFRDMLVISNSAFISDLFLKNENINLIIAGGMFNKKLNCFIGHHTINTIDAFNGIKFFLSSSYISVNGGISDIYHIALLDVKIQMFHKSKKSFLLIDSTKFEKIGPSKSFELDEIDCIITDRKIPENIFQEFKRHGIELIIA